MSPLHLIKMAGRTALSLLFVLVCLSINAQEKMEVDGIVHSKTGGFKFPDDTIQETAAAQLTGPEVSEQRGKMTIFFSGIPGVSVNLNFDVLDITFSSIFPFNINNVSQVMVTLNLEQDWPDFFAAFYNGILFNNMTIRYFDAGNNHYMSHKFTTCGIKAFEHFTIPFSTTEFGHIGKMSFDYLQLAITDEIGNNCKCYDIQLNSPNNCGCP